MPEKKEGKESGVLDRIFGNQSDTMKQKSEAENVAMIISEWLAPKHVRQKTRYTKKQVISVAILQSLADTYNIKTLKRFLQEFRVGKLSEDGKSSEELENILKARMPEIQESSLDKLTKFLE